jgi:hypothetical protein
MPSTNAQQKGVGANIPKSLMLYTPGTLELALRFGSAFAPSLGGLDDRPWTAESTFDKGVGAASAADMIGVIDFVLGSKGQR